MPESDCLPPDTTATDFVGQMARWSGLPRAAARERAAEVLRHVGLYEERYRPMGAYSTGMKQRVKLAQALVHDPQLLLLDEPTNGLDPAGRDEMLALVKRTGPSSGSRSSSRAISSGRSSASATTSSRWTPVDSLRSAALTTFTERTGTLAVDVEEGATRLAAALVAAGVEAVADGRTVLVELEDERPFDLVRDAVAELGLPLVRIEQRRHGLEELFRDRPDGAHDLRRNRRRRQHLRPRLPRLRRPAVRTAHRHAGAAPPDPPAAYGIGRGGRAKIAPFLLLILNTLPALSPSASRRW